MRERRRNKRGGVILASPRHWLRNLRLSSEPSIFTLILCKPWILIPKHGKSKVKLYFCGNSTHQSRSTSGKPPSSHDPSYSAVPQWTMLTALFREHVTSASPAQDQVFHFKFTEVPTMTLLNPKAGFRDIFALP